MTKATKKKARWSGTGSEREMQIKMRRDAVVSTAARLFTRNGYNATTLDDVAEELHVTKAALYYYIKDKDEILFECQREALHTLRGALEEIEMHDLPVRERLSRFVRAYAQVLAQDYGKCLIRIGLRQLKPESMAKTRPVVDQLDQGLMKLVEEGIEAGELRPGSALLLRNFIFGAFQGLTLWFNPDGRYSIEEVTEAYWDILSNGIFAQD